jgi:hypothetical protein
MSKAHEALQPSLITFGSREIARSSSPSPASISRNRCLFGWFGNDAGPQRKKGRTMLKRLLGAATVAAAAYSFGPAAYAAHHHVAHAGVGCSGDTFAKAEGDVEVMADGPGKFTAEREIAEAQDAMLSGKMGGCAMHLSRALRAESVPQAPYPGMMAPAPFASPAAQEAPQQPQSGFTPMKGAY